MILYSIGFVLFFNICLSFLLAIAKRSIAKVRYKSAIRRASTADFLGTVLLRKVLGRDCP